MTISINSIFYLYLSLQLKVIIIVATLFCPQSTYSQETIDSIFLAIANEQDNFKKGEILHKYDISLSPLDSINKLKVIEKFISLGKELQDESFIAEGYGRHGVYYIIRSQFEEGTSKIRKAIEILEAIPNRNAAENTRLGSYYNNLGIINMRIGNEKTAIIWYENAVDLFTEIDDKFSLASVLGTLGVQYSNIGQYVYSAEYFTKSEKLFDELGKPSINNKFNIARSFIKQQEYERAEDYVFQCKEMLSDIKDETIIYSVYELSTGYYLSKGDNDLALKEYEQSQVFFKEKEITLNKPRPHLNIINAYLDEEMYEEVDRMFQKVDIMGLPEKDLTLNALYHTKKGFYEFKLRKLQNSEASFKKALELYKDANALDDIADVYSQLSRINKEKGNFKKALDYQLQATALNDSISNEKVKLARDVQIIKYETEKKEIEISKLGNRNLQKEIQLAKQKSLLTGSIAGLSILGLLSFLLYRNSVKSKKNNLILTEKNKIIQNKNQQNETLLKEIHHRVKNNLQTISSLLYLQSTNITDQDAKEAISQGQRRVESMALIHKNLYQRDNLAGIEMKDYIFRLANNLKDACITNEQEIDIDINMTETELDVDTAIPLGLIINELLTNVFKYAFPEKNNGKIEISFSKGKYERFRLTIKDNGIGHTKLETGFGSQLIQLLTKQLEATFSDGNDNGYWCTIAK